MTRRPLLEVNDLKKHFPIRGGLLRRARRRYRLCRRRRLVPRRQGRDAGAGRRIAAAASPPSARAILRLFDITAGQVVLDGQRIDDLSAGALRPLRRRVQVVFQDPFSSLNPRMRVRDILAEPIRNFGLATIRRRPRATRSRRLMDTVRLPRDAVNRWPHEFSGGQRQRIGIARALAAEPDLIVCDEAVSALDVSVKAQIVNLLQDLQKELGLALLFISHDLAIVEHMTHRVAVMYLGKIVEVAPKRAIFAAPKHPYTEALLSAVPVPEPGAGAPAHHPEGRRAEPDQPAQGLPLPHPLPLRLRPLPRRGAAAAAGARPDTSRPATCTTLPPQDNPLGASPARDAAALIRRMPGSSCRRPPMIPPIES